MGEADDEIGHGCVLVDAGSACPTARPVWVDVHSDEPWLFGGDGTYGYYGYYGYDDEPAVPRDPDAPDTRECGTSVGQDREQTSWRRTCVPTGIEYIGRERPASATLGCVIPADAELCCYQFSCEIPDRG